MSPKRPRKTTRKKTLRDQTPTGCFITFEGTEGAGKSTLMHLVRQELEARGHSVLSTREPGGTPLAEKIRGVILEHAMDAKTELLLYEAVRADHVARGIRPALAAGRIVLCDRFTDSTLAYQSVARGLPWKEIQALNRSATGGLEPDLTVFLDIDVETGLKRAKDPNRFEAESLGFHRKVKKGFQKAGRENRKRWFTLKVIGQTPEALASKVLKKIFALKKRS